MTEAALNERIAELEEENAQLKRALKLTADQERFEAFRRNLGLTPQEAAVFCLMFDRYPNAAGKELIFTMLYSTKYGPEGGPDNEDHIVKVLVSKIRRKIGKKAIETKYGSYGLSDGTYRLTEAGHVLGINALP